ncbi:MAG: hypothetical protein JWM80_1086 [Cyanobacteria bacterium RYN_339]|nr:hypothetical protein [Cyanobacteria bacterium RYN_339]
MAGINQSDANTSMLKLNQDSSDIFDQIKALSESINDGMTAAQVQKIQVQIQERQRALDACKQAEEKVAKAAELMNKFVSTS